MTQWDRKRYWTEHDNPDRLIVAGWSRAILAALATLAVVALVLIGTWWFRVSTSDVRGQGNAERTKNAASNRIAAQERFESLYAEIKATDAKLDVLAADKSANAQTRLTGTKTYCLSVIADYDALARKYRSQDFRSVDLPAQIDTNNPATDCKETQK